MPLERVMKPYRSRIGVRVMVRAGLVALALGAFWTPGQAGSPLIERSHAEIRAIQADLVGQEGDFDELLELRERIEPLRDDLRDLVGLTGKARDSAKAALAEIGGEPAYPAPSEADSAASARHELQKSFGTADADYKQAQLALNEADSLWGRLTDLRRDAFAKQIFLRTLSPLNPEFWSRLIGRGLPATVDRTRKAYRDEAERVVSDGVGRSSGILVGVFATLLVVFFATHRWLARRAAANVGAVDGVYDRRAAIRHAFFALLMRSVPFPLIFGLFDLAVEYFDLSSDNVDTLIARSAVAILIISASRGIMAAVLAPAKPRFRLILCADETAKAIYNATLSATNIFVLGIFLTAYEDIISAPNSVILTTSLAVTIGVCLSFAHGLFLVRNRPGDMDFPVLAAAERDPESDTPIALSLGWVRPILVLAMAVGLAALAAGYVTFAGFLMSRVTIVVLVVALAILLSLFIEEAFGNVLTSRTAAGRAFAHAIGLNGAVLDLISTTIAGLLRLVIFSLALVFAFGPWGIRFGDINPFNDDLFAFSFAYIRFSVGTVSFALLTFVVGLLGTRLIVGWLDRRLLPLTSLDQGVRNSMTTVLGYIGFAVTLAVALSQLGVNPQNLTVVAGALSVGIGFGLQAITSNFISGLIVLAERPIRVGDIVSVKGEEGRVKKISVRSTLIGGFDRTDIIVPNTDILTSIVRNKSLTDREYRLRFSIMIDQSSDPDAVERIMLDCAADHRHVMKEPEPGIYFLRASDEGLEFEMRCFVDDLDNTDRVRSDLHFHMMRRFRSRGIKLAGAVAAHGPTV